MYVFMWVRVSILWMVTCTFVYPCHTVVVVVVNFIKHLIGQLQVGAVELDVWYYVRYTDCKVKYQRRGKH